LREPANASPQRANMYMGSVLRANAELPEPGGLIS